ncbi:MAG: DUF6530 family protein [Bacteroidales bacterium]|nr:DUF6530 family protein [Bacteroidales bacterium]
MNIPQNLSHKPIIAVDYKSEDSKAGSGDALFLSIGEATWNNSGSSENKLDYSAKAFRWVETSKRWSPQSEELPFWRVIDLATLLIAVINDKKSYLNEGIVNQGKNSGLRQYIEENKDFYQDKINKLKEIINE